MMNADKREAPDRTYWTPYDYYMTERDARARRRARAYARLVTLARRASQFLERSVRLSIPLTQTPPGR